MKTREHIASPRPAWRPAARWLTTLGVAGAVAVGSGACAHGAFSIGSAIDVLPRGYVSLQFGEEPLYFHDGVFFEPRGGEFIVVGPPVGAVVPYLPGGAQWVNRGGVRYAMYRDVYYRPTFRGRNTMYIVVRLRE